jgi:tetraacyldisaccharide 4'-kinase
LLWPLSVLYGSIALLRRLFYEVFGLRKEGKLPSLVIGNLTVGGTGKTPMVMFVANLLRDTFSMAVLSRGYGRNTKGYLEINQFSEVSAVGDEPFEIFENLYVFFYTFSCRHSNMTQSKKRYIEINFDPNLMIYRSNES